MSEKKTAQQSISLSPALKDWLQRYVNVNHREKPKDKKFKSISAFVTYTLEEALKLVE